MSARDDTGPFWFLPSAWFYGCFPCFGWQGPCPIQIALDVSGVMTMLKRFLVAAAVVLTVGTPALAADSENLQTFRAVQKQVLQYPHFTIFDNVDVQVNNGTVTLLGKVTMP